MAVVGRFGAPAPSLARDSAATGGSAWRGAPGNGLFDRALEHAGGHLVSRERVMRVFAPMQGAGEHRSVPVRLHGVEVSLHSEELSPAGGESLAGVLSAPRHEAWSGITTGRTEPSGSQDRWLATALPGSCLPTARQEAVDSGLVSPAWRMGTPAPATAPVRG